MAFLVGAVAMVLLNSAAPLSGQAQSRPTQGPLPPIVPGYEYARDLGDRDSFGTITDVALVGGDMVAVLDAMNSSVSLFDLTTGALLATFGRRGQGPGELFYPVALASHGSVVSVLDQGNVRLLTLAADGNSLQLRAESRISIANPQDLCFIGERRFVLGVREGLLIHEVDPDGTVIRSFGSASREDPTGGELSAVGRLACTDSQLRIAHVRSLFGLVEVFSDTGTSIWSGSIPGYVRQEYEVSNTSLRPLRPEKGFIHQIGAFQWTGRGTLLVQLRKTSEGYQDPLEIRLLDPPSGWRPPPPTLPAAEWLGETLALFREEAPFPALKVYRAK